MHKVLSRTVLAIAAAGTMALSACTAPMFGIVNNGPVANLSGSDYAKSGNMKRIHAKVSTTYVFGFPVDAIARTVRERTLCIEPPLRMIELQMWARYTNRAWHSVYYILFIAGFSVGEDIQM